VQVTEADKRQNRKPKKMPWVNPVMCEGCGDCAQRCPRQGLKLTETNVEGVFVPWLDEPEACSGCGKCASCCVSGAIQMTEYVDLAMARFKEKRPWIPV
jgi:NAD-dependent dihydropyrimidine dehydrogenase PreA subunit